MNGLLIYEKAEIERNRSFIDRLINASSQYSLTLTVVDDQSPIPEADFIFFRSRNPHLAKQLEQRNILKLMLLMYVYSCSAKKYWVP